MLSNPPDDPMRRQGHTSIAWPIDLLKAADGSGKVVGFLMPRVSGLHPIIDYYNPGTRRKQCPLFSYRYLLHTARNLAAVRALHARGYIIGDVNESNILVSDTALVTLVDTDSFQVRDTTSGQVYRCPVGKPEYTPPELQGTRFADIDRFPEHDLFGLAVLLFQLLMEGSHPFAGKYTGQGDVPALEKRIKAGHFPYGTGRVPYQPMPAAPPFDTMPTGLRLLFLRCFEMGHSDPKARPTADEWQKALDTAIASLQICAVNSQHQYGSHLPACPWCERVIKLNGLDPFPSDLAVQQGVHLKPAPPPQVALPPARKTPQSSTISPPAPSSITSAQQAKPSQPIVTLRPAAVAPTPSCYVTVGLLTLVALVGWGGITAYNSVGRTNAGPSSSNLNGTFAQKPPLSNKPANVSTRTASRGSVAPHASFKQGSSTQNIRSVYQGAISEKSWVITIHSVKTKEEANRLAHNFLNRGFDTGVLWIPDYPSMSGAKKWLAYVGPLPYSEREKAGEICASIRRLNPGAYAIKVDQQGPRETFTK